MVVLLDEGVVENKLAKGGSIKAAFVAFALWKQRGRREEEENEWREREGVFISREVMIGGLTFGCQKETNVSHSNAAHKGSLRLGQNEPNAGMKVAFQGRGKAAFHKRTKGMMA